MSRLIYCYDVFCLTILFSFVSKFDKIFETLFRSHAESNVIWFVSQAGKGTLIRMLKTQPVRSALILGCGMQMFQQLCGINTVM